MGHRAAIAYIQPDDSIKARYSHWGALEARLAHGPDSIRESDPLASGDVREEVEGEYRSLSEWAENHVDFLHHECAYVVDTRVPTWTVDAYDTCWFKSGEDAGAWTTVGEGILVKLRSGDRWTDFSGSKDAPDCGEKNRETWTSEMLEWLGEDTQRIPDFSPLPADNRV